MRILLLCHAFNSLTQRLFVELEEQQHEISVEFDINDDTSLEAVQIFEPDIIIAPYLKRAIPAAIWKKYTCLIVHPGIVGDRGPSALDWAILNNQPEWGVTVLQANDEMDAGDIWSSVSFPMRNASKASLYRNEVTEAAVQAVNMALERFQQPDYPPTPLAQANTKGQWQPLMQQTDRAINWQNDSTSTILRKINSADGFPGVQDHQFGRELYLYDASPDPDLNGEAGKLIARNQTAVCVATIDGAIWIGHMKDKHSPHPFKLPAVQVLATEIELLPNTKTGDESSYQIIRYEEIGDTGFLFFDFYNGAMSTKQCNELRDAFIKARQRPTRVIVLMGGTDFWSNGMHLNQIEAADSAADESWMNINAIDDLALEVINTDTHWVISAMQGNAGAGGVFLARSADEVWARNGIVLNPHYKDMGNLYGSEYWTYLLPRHAGEENVYPISEARLPMGVNESVELGLVDKVLDVPRENFYKAVQEEVLKLLKPPIDQPTLEQRLVIKRKQREDDEAIKPLEEYREEELDKMKQNFYGFDTSYHVARYNFVYKIPKSRTPLTIARHRRTSDILRRAS